MTSQAQKLKGYPIPEEIAPEGNRCIAIMIPDDDAYHRAVIGQVTDLMKWWNWQRTSADTQEGKLSAEAMTNSLKFTPVGETIPCEILESEGDVIVTDEEALCQAVECGIINVFARAVNGSAGNVGVNVSFDEEGNPILEEGGLSQGSNVTVSSARQLMAKMEYIENRLEEFLGDFESYYADTSADQDTMELFLSSKYLCDESQLTSAVTNYIAHRQAMNPAPIPTLDNLDRVMYCKGATPQVVSAWVIDDTIADTVLRLDMLTSILQQQYLTWAEQETSLSDDYISTLCYRAPQQTLYWEADQVAPNIKDRNNPAELALYANTRANLIITGKVSNANGDFWDGIYRDIGGTKVYRPMQITHGSFVTGAPQYSSNGYELLHTVGSSIIKIRFDSGLPDVPPFTGELQIQWNDVGQVT